MNDREFLIWIHERLRCVHRESELVDYMHKLRAVIAATPRDQETPNVACANGIDGLREFMVTNDRERRPLFRKVLCGLGWHEWGRWYSKSYNDDFHRRDCICGHKMKRRA